MADCVFTAKLECMVCGRDIDMDMEWVNYPFRLGRSLLTQLEEAGWMEMESEQYGQIGYTCPGCIKAEKHWEIEEGLT